MDEEECAAMLLTHDFKPENVLMEHYVSIIPLLLLRIRYMIFFHIYFENLRNDLKEEIRDWKNIRKAFGCEMLPGEAICRVLLDELNEAEFVGKRMILSGDGL